MRPFESLEETPPPSPTPLKYRVDFTRLVQEARGGIRLGSIDEVQVDVQMKTAEDAVGLAALSRWLPGMVQMKQFYSPESALADLAENLMVSPTGDTVSLSFAIDESQLADVVKAFRARHERGPVE